jgi:hypothetical protein
MKHIITSIFLLFALITLGQSWNMTYKDGTPIKSYFGLECDEKDDLTMFQEIERKKFHDKYSTGYHKRLKPKTPSSAKGKELLNEVQTILKEYYVVIDRNDRQLLTDKDTPLDVIVNANCQIEKKLKAKTIKLMVLVLLELNEIDVVSAQSYLTAVESNHSFFGNKLSRAFHNAYHKDF